ncbi:MAG TPA: serine/threonine-protein kinase [Thermoanaerobaculia bacterium]|nr:serine/threonine-protein kinase [Thermoanaerobaculia bacterium]
MDMERWQQVRSLFGSALERSTEEWPVWLVAACGSDAALRDEVQSLLAAHHGGGSLLPEPGPSSPDPLIGQQIGPYEVQRRLGGGGMGIVYLAARIDGQFRKRVALKVLKPGMDSEEILRRFRTERQILAALDHPNIARLLDGGTTGRGLPFFVMEYVEGRPITAYCEQEGLPITARLELFRTVCSAVQFAHQNLVVHRDLKPANILVGGDGTPKLLDFGIAKLLNPELAAQTLALTSNGAQPLTLEYASPEQIRGGHITTASDVYSLGVVLYELLSGRHPYRDGCTIEEMVHQVTEVEPAAPSSAASQRESRTLAGDLDCIVLTALRKEPRHRYASVEQLSADIRRFLEGRPILARKATVGYRFGKFARRHRLGVAVAATALLAVLLFGAGMGALALRLAQERERAELAQRRAEQVTAFLTEIFEVSDPRKSSGETITARAILDAGARRIGTDLEDQPEVQADLMATLGMIYHRLGLGQRALPLVEAALARRRQLLGPDHPKVAQSLNDLGVLQERDGKYPAAEASYRQALAIRRQQLGPLHPDVVESLSDLAAVLWAQGEYEAAEKQWREVLAMRRKLFGDGHVAVAGSLNNLAIALFSRGRYREAEPLLREALAIRRALLGETHVEVADGLGNLAQVLQAQGSHAEAERLERARLDLYRKLLDRDHPHVARSLNNLGFLLQIRGRYREAEPLQLEALAIRRQRLGETHPDVAQSLYNLGVVAEGLGDLAAAENHHRAALDIRRSVFGGEHPHVADSLGQLASIQVRQGRMDSAEAYLREALAIRRKALGPDHPETATLLGELAALSATKGEFAACEGLAREAVGRLAAVQTPETWTWEAAAAQSVLGSCLSGLGRLQEGRPLLAASYSALRMKLGEDALPTRDAHRRLLSVAARSR